MPAFASASAASGTAALVQPMPSRATTLSRLLVRIRNKMETTKRRTWYELQREHYYTHPPAVHNTAELATALQHFHVSATEDELRLLLVSFQDDSVGGFSFKRMAARLYPTDREDGWGFEPRPVSSGSAVKRPQSGLNKTGMSQAAAFTATASAFPVVFASSSSANATAIAASVSKPAATMSTGSNRKTSTAKSATAAAAYNRTAAVMSSTRPSAAVLHHSSRYVKQATSIGRVYTERQYDSSEHETQRTAYIKYVNDGYWVRV